MLNHLLYLLLPLLAAAPAPQSSYAFVEFPHLRMFDGRLGDLHLSWGTQAPSLLNASRLDLVQRAAGREGLLSATRRGGALAASSPAIHVFSAAEARQCLANRTIAVAGDSYMRILLIGLADVLLGHPGESEAHSKEARIQLQEERMRRLEALRRAGTVRTRLLWVLEGCYYQSLDCLLRELSGPQWQNPNPNPNHSSNTNPNSLREIDGPQGQGQASGVLSRVDALVLNSMTHSLEAVRGSTLVYNAQLSALFRLARGDLRLNLTWFSAPFVMLRRAPDKVR